MAKNGATTPQSEMPDAATGTEAQPADVQPVVKQAGKKGDASKTKDTTSGSGGTRLTELQATMIQTVPKAIEAASKSILGIISLAIIVLGAAFAYILHGTTGHDPLIGAVVFVVGVLAFMFVCFRQHTREASVISTHAVTGTNMPDSASPRTVTKKTEVQFSRGGCAVATTMTTLALLVGVTNFFSVRPKSVLPANSRPMEVVIDDRANSAAITYAISKEFGRVDVFVYSKLKTIKITGTVSKHNGIKKVEEKVKKIASGKYSLYGYTIDNKVHEAIARNAGRKD